jgi:hypothetical protein
MRKRIALLIALSLFAVTVLFSWEGAATAAPEGALPAKGFYVATNSFPKNTVVDITNLETKKTTRAIVANGLDTPGLLAIVSREAAELIGMRRGSVSTIRMVQPTDPAAYSRFTEGIASGSPYYSSGDVIAEELYNEDTYKPPRTADSEKSKAASSITGPSYVLEPEWRARGAAPYIPGTASDYTYTASPVPEKKTEEPPAIAEPVPEKKIEEPPVIVEPIPEKKIEEPPVIAEPVPEKKVEEPPVIAEPVPEKKIEEPPVIAEPVPEKKVEEPPVIVEPVPEKKIEEPPAITGVTPPAKEFILTPTDEKPPPENTIYGIDPSLIIPGITSAPPAKEPEELVLQPMIPSIADDTFSVPSITRLVRGKYYVQVASYDKPESVENELKQIDPRYNPVVFKANDAVYRILLGPLNQGESAAILQRFKSIGYKNAFVRYEK